jgi:hypothetical protein
MTRFVIDPHALIDFVREGQRLGAGHQLVAPNAIRSQALQLLLLAVRDEHLTEQEALALHERITEVNAVLKDAPSRRGYMHRNDACQHARPFHQVTCR